MRDVLEREGVEGGKEHSKPPCRCIHSHDTNNRGSGMGEKSSRRSGIKVGRWVGRERLRTFETQLREAVPRLLIISVHLVPPCITRGNPPFKCWCFPPSCPRPSATRSGPRLCPGLAEGKAMSTLPWPIKPRPSAHRPYGCRGRACDGKPINPCPPASRAPRFASAIHPARLDAAPDHR
jgi:hypothetical protein